MTKIDKDKLKSLDAEIDSALGREELLGIPRDIALIELLRVFEDYARLYAMRKRDFKMVGPILKTGQDGMHFAVNWLYRYCPPPTRKANLDSNTETYLAAGQLHGASTLYSGVWDLMSLLHRGTVIGERDGDGTIYLQYQNPEAELIETAGHFVATPDAPDFMEGGDDLFGIVNQEEFLSSVKIRRHGNGIKYFASDEFFERIKEAQRRMLSSKWELDGQWDLGGYTLSQFQEFWIALLSICWINHCACLFSGIKGGALDSVVKMMGRNGWEAELCRRSGLEQQIVSSIITDLTYDTELYTAGKKTPDVTSQPFFRLRGQLLALSGQLVMLSNAERNLWDLLSIKRPEIHSRLRNLKEELWLRQLMPRLESYGLRSLGPINFAHNGQKSDLDLLILDDAARFGLGLQLKWLTHPDRIGDVSNADKELTKGLDQSELALEWLVTRPTKLQDLTGLSSGNMESYEFKTAVLSKNTLGSASTERAGVPILTDRVMDWILGSPHHASLRALWQVGEEKRYMPKRGEHFADADSVTEFGGSAICWQKNVDEKAPRMGCGKGYRPKWSSWRTGSSCNGQDVVRVGGKTCNETGCIRHLRNT